MGHAKIKYRLSEEGQKAALRSGQPAQREQVLDVPGELLGQAVELGTVSPDGDVTVTVESGDSVHTGYEVTARRKSLLTGYGYTNDEIDQSSYQVPEMKQIICQWPKNCIGDFDAPQDVGALLSVQEALVTQREASRVQCQEQIAAIADFKAAAEQARDEILAEHELRSAAREEEKRLKKAARKAAVEKAKTERDAWISEHGSERLQAILEEGFIDDSEAVYRDERLAIDRPGWIFDDHWHNGEVEYNDPRNPPHDALIWLREVRQDFPGVELRFARLREASAYDYEENSYTDDIDVRELVLLDKFLGKYIVLRRGE